MLSKIRELANSIFVKIFLGIIVVTVVFWGIGDKGSSKHYIASIDGDHYIYIKDFVKAKKNLEQLITRNSPSINLSSININQIILNNLIQNKLMEIEFQSLGMHIGDNTAIAQIQNNPALHNEKGVFDKNYFKSILINNRMSESEYVNDIKTNIASEFLLASISSFNAPEIFSNYFHQYNNQTRTIDLVQISGNLKSGDLKISNKDIEKYYNNHKNDFATPEYRNIEYIVITPSNFVSDVEVSEEEVDDAAMQMLPQPDSQSDLDLQPKSQPNSKSNTQTTIASKASTSSQSTEVEPTVNDTLSASQKHTLKTKLIEQKSEQLMYEKMKEIEDYLASGDTLQEVASKFKLIYKDIPFIDKHGSFQSKKTQTPETYYPHSIIKEAFKLNESEPSDAIQIGNNKVGYYIVNIKKIKPSIIPTINELKEKIEPAVFNEQKEQLYRSRAMEVYNKFSNRDVTTHEATNISVIKKLHPNSDISTIQLSRPDMSNNNFSQSTLNTNTIVDIFNLKKPQDFTFIFKTKNNNFAFAILRSINTPDASSLTEENKKHLKTQLSSLFSGLINQELSQYLQSKHKVTVHTEMLNTI